MPYIVHNCFFCSDPIENEDESIPELTYWGAGFSMVVMLPTGRRAHKTCVEERHDIETKVVGPAEVPGQLSLLDDVG